MVPTIDDNDDQPDIPDDEIIENDEIKDAVRQEVQRQLKILQRGFVSTATFLKLRTQLTDHEESCNGNNQIAVNPVHDGYLRRIGEAEIEKLRKEGETALIQAQEAKAEAKRKYWDWCLGMFLKAAAILSLLAGAITYIYTHYKP